MTEIEYCELIERLFSRLEREIGAVRFEQVHFEDLLYAREDTWPFNEEWVYSVGTLSDDRAITISHHARGKETIPGVWPARPDQNEPIDLEATITTSVKEAILRLNSYPSDEATSKVYVNRQEGTFRIVGTRVSLDSIVYAYHRGASPESIQRSFPSLTLEEVHGALAYYLSHKQEIDKYLTQGEEQFDALERSSREEHADWYDRLRRARKETMTSHS